MTTVAFDAGSSGTLIGGSPLTVAHTVGGGSNTALVVGCTDANGSDFLAGATATYNGVSMGAARVSDTTWPTVWVYMWVLAAPAAGTHNIVITPTSSAVLQLMAASFTGVDQTTPVNATAHSSDDFAVSPYSTNITTTAGGMAVDMFSRGKPGVALVADGSQTEVAAQADDTAGRSGMSYKSGASAMQWTWAGAGPTDSLVGHCIVALKAAAAGGTTVAGRKLLLGVGA